MKQPVESTPIAFGRSVMRRWYWLIPGIIGSFVIPGLLADGPDSASAKCNYTAAKQTFCLVSEYQMAYLNSLLQYAMLIAKLMRGGG